MISLASAAAHADVVSDWAELQTAFDNAADDPTAPFDPGMFQAFSKTTLAMFEAANSVDPKYVSWLNVARAPAGASQVAAVSVAAHDVLIALYPAKKEKIDCALVFALADIPTGSGRDAGIAAGHAAAVAALAAGGMDLARPKGNYRPSAPALARTAAQQQAASNRAKHGLTKNERESLRAEAVRAARLLDGVKRESKS